MNETLTFDIRHYKEVTSTNSVLKKEAEEGAAEGLVISADYQSEGRGKPGSKWVSPRGENLLFSVLLRPSLSAAKIPILTQFACQAVAKAMVTHYDIKASFKRPNDVMVNGKKICGILTEASSTSQGEVSSVIVGVGFNVNSDPKALDPNAISLKKVICKPLDRNLVQNQLLEALKEAF